MTFLLYLDLASRIFFIALFIFSAVMKLTDSARFLGTLTAFGVPKKLLRIPAVLIPALEIGIALVLCVQRGTQAGSIGVFALLVVFTTIIVLKLLQGERPVCNCFGSSSLEPIGKRTVYRNVALICLATGFTLTQASIPRETISAFDESVFNDIGTSNMLTVVIVAALLAQAWFIFHLISQHGRLMLKLDAVELRMASVGIAAVPSTEPIGLPIGTLAPDFSLPQPAGGKEISLSLLKQKGLPIFIVFSDVACGPCRDLMPEVHNWLQTLSSQVSFVIVMRGDEESVRREAGRNQHVVMDIDGTKAAANFHALVTPSALLLSSKGIVSSHLALGADAIKELLESSIVREEQTDLEQSVSYV